MKEEKEKMLYVHPVCDCYALHMEGVVCQSTEVDQFTLDDSIEI